MRRTAGLLVEDQLGWTLFDARQPASVVWQGSNLSELSSNWEQVARVKDALLERVLVVPGADSFLFGMFPQSEVGGSQQFETLRYRLEADLPLSAEEMLCDFQFPKKKTTTSCISAVATDRARWREFTQRMQAVGCRMVAITPKSLSVIQALIEKREIASDSLIMLELDSRYEIVLLQRGQVVGWRVPGDVANAIRDWSLVQGECEVEQRVRIVADTVPASAAAQILADVPTVAINMTELIQSVGLPWIEGRATPWFDVTCDDQLSGQASPTASARRLGMTLAAVILVVAAAVYWRSVRIRSAGAAIRGLQSQLYQEAFPGQRIPTAFMARLRSEHAKIVGSRSADTNIELPSAALPTLERVILGFPEDVELAVHELRVENSEVYVDVEVSQYQEAGRIAEQLQASGLEMTPPTTSAGKGERVRAQLRGMRPAGGAQ